MAALDYLTRAGLTAEAVAGKLRVSPAERITPEIRLYITNHKGALLAELEAANDTAPTIWLHLLALADSSVVQVTCEQTTAQAEQDARRRYGDALLRVVPVPGFRRYLTEREVVEALAGTLPCPAPAPGPTPAPSSLWLARVARLLGTRPADLLEGGHLEPCDLEELAGTDAALVADLIRNSPHWIDRPQRKDSSSSAGICRQTEPLEPQRVIQTAHTATAAWIAARDAFHGHALGGCPHCYPPRGHYCPTGVDLRDSYARETNTVETP